MRPKWEKHCAVVTRGTWVHNAFYMLLVIRKSTEIDVVIDDGL